MICCAYIEKHTEMLTKYPILQLAYNLDGSKKDIITLLKDRNTHLENGEELKTVNELYRTIANQKNFFIGGLTGIKTEILALGKYIKETGTDDEFVYDLLRDRLKMKNLSPERIEALIQEQKKVAEIRRKQLKDEQEKGIQEIEQEKSDNIRDEVGDEFKPKTEHQKQEEQQVETMWQSRFQSWDRDSVDLPNATKRKQEVVQVMKKIEKEKEVEKQEKNDELQQ